MVAAQNAIQKVFYKRLFGDKTAILTIVAERIEDLLRKLEFREMGQLQPFAMTIAGLFLITPSLQSSTTVILMWKYVPQFRQ